MLTREDHAIKVENKEFPTRMIGVVEKCTACYERLAIGQAAACAEASTGAIVSATLRTPIPKCELIAEKYTIRESRTRDTAEYLLCDWTVASMLRRL